jgi:hypothetical protein
MDARSMHGGCRQGCGVPMAQLQATAEAPRIVEPNSWKGLLSRAAELKPVRKLGQTYTQE